MGRFSKCGAIFQACHFAGAWAEKEKTAVKFLRHGKKFFKITKKMLKNFDKNGCCCILVFIQLYQNKEEGYTMKTWFITGASRGLGRAFAEAALQRGDRVAATSRKLQSVQDFRDRYGDAALPVELDVCNPQGCRDAFQKAVEYFGQVDVLVNNAGYICLGTVEELSEEMIRREMETLFFGPMFLCQEAVKHMRPRRSGAIVQTSSLAALDVLAANSMYGAGKWALEGMTEALHKEMEPFGIKVLMIEPGAIRTGIASTVEKAPEMREYDACPAVMAQRNRWLGSADPTAVGDADKCAQVLLQLVDSDNPPFRLLMSSEANDIGLRFMRERLAEAEAYEALGRSVDGDK